MMVSNIVIDKKYIFDLYPPFQVHSSQDPWNFQSSKNNGSIFVIIKI